MIKREKVIITCAISFLVLRAYTIDERELTGRIEAHSLAENEI